MVTDQHHVFRIDHAVTVPDTNYLVQMTGLQMPIWPVRARKKQ